MIGASIFVVPATLAGSLGYYAPLALLACAIAIASIAICFAEGGSRVPTEVPPYMLHAGSDEPRIRTINLVGMQRRGISSKTIEVVKKAYKLLYREHKNVDSTLVNWESVFADRERCRAQGRLSQRPATGKRRVGRPKKTG